MSQLSRSPIRMAFFGSSLVSAYWNGAATYYRGILRALAEKGFDITFFEPDAFERQQHRDIDDPPYARSVVYPPTVEGARAVLEQARGCDIVVKASGVGVLDGFLEEAVLDLKAPDTRVLFWDVDAPATLYEVQHNPESPFRRLIPEYDLILTYGGGDPVVREYEALSANRCVPVYNALDPDMHYPIKAEPLFSGTLGFLGNRAPDREERMRTFFFEVARRRPEHRFLLAGSGWDHNLPPLLNLEILGHLYTHEHNAFNSSCTAVLNINREGMARYGFTPPTRIFEAAGAEACVITDAWEGIEMFLEPGQECLMAKDGDEVEEILGVLTPAIAHEIGRAARARILEEHTYAHRAAQVLALLHETGCGAKVA